MTPALGPVHCRSEPAHAPTVLALIFALCLAGTRTVEGQVPVEADLVACNEEASRAVKARTVSPTSEDHARAASARGSTLTTSPGDSTRRTIDSADPQIHGMEAEGAKSPMYQAAYRSCMRRKGF